MDTAIHPAPQRHTEFTPVCFPSPNGRGSRNSDFPPWPRKTAWQHSTQPTKYDNALLSIMGTANHPAPQRRAEFPEWHGLTQTHVPPWPHKTAWHSDLHTDNVSLIIAGAANHPAPLRHAESTQAHFTSPQWHGLTQTRFPPQPRKTTWHSDITDGI